MTATDAPYGCSIRLIDLPYSIGAMVALDEEGYASIYINARHSIEKQKRNLIHELRHLKRDDVYNDKSIYMIEGYLNEGVAI